VPSPPKDPLPDLRPFRALRYEPSRVGDLAKVVAPPYDVIDEETRARLIARDPVNVVRLDMPVEEPGDGPDDRYRRAARTLAAWRSDGTLRKDPQPSIYAYEQRYHVPETARERTQRGFFARLRLEPYGPDSDVLPHERTLSGPKEDRYKLLRATGVNTSPVVMLFADISGESEERLAAVAGGQPDIDVTDDDGVCHRMWALPASGDGPASIVAGALLEAAGAGPLTIADGHHRYETALRYRDERRMTRSCDEDPAFDYVLVLMLEATRQDLTVLPTHRLVRRIGSDGAERLLSRTPELFDVESVASSDALVTALSGSDASGGRGRFGLWTRTGGAILTARRDAFEPFLPKGGEAVRSLDVTLLAAALDRLAGIDREAVADGAIGYTKSAEDAVAAVEAGSGADAAFLLEPTPVISIEAVAREGDVMPQKSTYFYPKALTGLVINPHEW
jgi:uncharacterized protein (DUF1015 family)